MVRYCEEVFVSFGQLFVVKIKKTESNHSWEVKPKRIAEDKENILLLPGVFLRSPGQSFSPAVSMFVCVFVCVHVCVCVCVC
jgi:hypothetical protein